MSGFSPGSLATCMTCMWGYSEFAILIFELVAFLSLHGGPVMSRRHFQGAPCRSAKGSREPLSGKNCLTGHHVNSLREAVKWSRTSIGAVWHREDEAMTEEFKVEEGLQGEAPLVHCSDGQADR